MCCCPFLRTREMCRVVTTTGDIAGEAYNEVTEKSS